MKDGDNLKICLVGSSGGHLAHLWMLKDFWSSHERFWVTFDKEDARALLKNERMYPCHYPSNHSLKALLINTRVAWRVLRKERPALILSCGAAAAVPFFYLGKLFGAKTLFIEVFNAIDKPTLTGRLVHPVTDLFVLQWPEQMSMYRGAMLFGPIF